LLDKNKHLKKKDQLLAEKRKIEEELDYYADKKAKEIIKKHEYLDNNNVDDLINRKWKAE
jgi:hypothetical protein